MPSNPNLDPVNINAYAKCAPIPSSYWAAMKVWHKSRVITLLEICKLMKNSPNIDFVNIKVYAKLCWISSIHSDLSHGPWLYYKFAQFDA